LVGCWLASDASGSCPLVSFAFMVVSSHRDNRPARSKARGHFPRWNTAPRGRSVSTTQYHPQPLMPFAVRKMISHNGMPKWLVGGACRRDMVADSTIIGEGI